MILAVGVRGIYRSPESSACESSKECGSDSFQKSFHTFVFKIQDGELFIQFLV
jgi:hypothetical protein